MPTLTTIITAVHADFKPLKRRYLEPHWWLIRPRTPRVTHPIMIIWALLRYGIGWKQNDIAHKYGVTEATVSSNLETVRFQYAHYSGYRDQFNRILSRLNEEIEPFARRMAQNDTGELNDLYKKLQNR